MKHWIDKCGRYGTITGLVAGPFLTYSMIRGMSNTNVYDFCYRIRYNKRQLRVDRMSLVGAAAGAVAASYLGDSGTLGALVGMNSGMAFAMILNYVILSS